MISVWAVMILLCLFLTLVQVRTACSTLVSVNPLQPLFVEGIYSYAKYSSIDSNRIVRSSNVPERVIALTNGAI